MGLNPPPHLPKCVSYSLLYLFNVTPSQRLLKTAAAALEGQLKVKLMQGSQLKVVHYQSIPYMSFLAILFQRPVLKMYI